VLTPRSLPTALPQSCQCSGEALVLSTPLLPQATAQFLLFWERRDVWSKMSYQKIPLEQHGLL